MEANWICSICNSDEHYPMMIIKCGHTFCEHCLSILEICPICRMSFKPIDCQPNYALASDKQHVTSTPNLATKLKNLAKKMHISAECTANWTVESIIDQIDNHLISNPKLLVYPCKIDYPSVELFDKLFRQLDPHGIYIHIPDKLNTILAEKPESIIVDISLRLPIKLKMELSNGANGNQSMQSLYTTLLSSLLNPTTTNLLPDNENNN